MAPQARANFGVLVRSLAPLFEDTRPLVAHAEAASAEFATPASERPSTSTGEKALSILAYIFRN